MRRIAALLAFAVVATAGCGAPRAASADVLAREAARWLWSRQAGDGGWHSETYGLLRSGQALTPFVLAALLDVPIAAAPRPPGGVARALAFLRARLDDRGRLGRGDPDLLEYPNYATAYALVCLVRVGDPSDRARVARMGDYLLDQQYREENGFRPEDPAYGGWGFGSTQPRGVPGHMDLAHTRRVLEALRAADRLDAATAARAATFLARMQKRGADGYDGGFYFSPVVLAANKGQRDGAAWRSYATATCDGLLALRALGVEPTDERVVAARAWLARFPDPDLPGGIPADQPTPWREAIRLYHAAARAEVESSFAEATPRRDLLATRLAALRRPDGSFANPNVLMKEDDPLIATTFALTALR